MNEKLRGTLCMVGVCLLLSSCATIRLKKQLDAPLKGWLTYHESLMSAKVPKWLDERGGRELGHFLRLSREMQKKYVSMFWQMREEGAEEIYRDRIGIANGAFTNEGKPGWKTDRGHVLLACGSPQFIRIITVSDLAFDFESNPKNKGRTFLAPPSDFDGTVYIHWTYYYKNRGVRFTFQYAHSGYVLSYGSLNSIGQQGDIMSYSKRLFAPTEDGWYLWGSELLKWVKEQENK